MVQFWRMFFQAGDTGVLGCGGGFGVTCRTRHGRKEAEPWDLWATFIPGGNQRRSTKRGTWPSVPKQCTDPVSPRWLPSPARDLLPPPLAKQLAAELVVVDPGGLPGEWDWISHGNRLFPRGGRPILGNGRPGLLSVSSPGRVLCLASPPNSPRI